MVSIVLCQRRIPSFDRGQIFAFEESGGVSVALFIALHKHRLSHLQGCWSVCSVDFMLGTRIHAIHAMNWFLPLPRLGLAPPPTLLISVKALTCLKESTQFPIEVETEQVSLLLQSEMRIAKLLSRFRLNQQQRKSPWFCFVYVKWTWAGTSRKLLCIGKPQLHPKTGKKILSVPKHLSLCHHLLRGCED